MKKVTELINEWAEFDEQYPDLSIEDFCRHYLISKREEREENKTEEIAEGILPPQTDTLLMKLLGRISAAGQVYCRKALSDIPVITLVGFQYLGSIFHKGESQKTDIINYNLSELSTGIDTLNKLLEEGFISERRDPSDKRAKLVKHTEKGKEILFECYRRLHSIGSLLFDDLAEEDKKLCIQLLKSTEIKHSKLALRVKKSELDEVFVDIKKGWGDCSDHI